MPARERNIIDLANEVVTNKVQRELGTAVIKVRSLDLGMNSDQDKIRAVEEANSWIRWTADSDDLYEENRFRLFKGPNQNRGLRIVRGHEIGP